MKICRTAIACSLIFAFGCEDDDTTQPDAVPPGTVGNLTATQSADSSVTLTWTAPGDDLYEGTSSQYDVRYAASSTNATEWWDSIAVAIADLPTPQAAGNPETLMVTGLTPDSTHYFALRTADEVPNWSDLSNVAEARTANEQDIRWCRRFGPPPWGQGMNDAIEAFAVFNGDLIAGGSFTQAGTATVNNIARWDGATWHALGEGRASGVHALAVFEGDLIAAGGGEAAANRIARWDGTAWHPLGSVTSGFMSALAVYEGDLIAGGHFNDADGTRVNNIARWDGTSWHPLGTGVTGWDGCFGSPAVAALLVHEGRLFVGGTFTWAGNVPANAVASWDGTSWYLEGPPFDGTPWEPSGASVYALASYEGMLIAGGYFSTHPVFENAFYICIVGGGLQRPLLPGLDGWVSALAIHEGSLVVGGSFTGTRNTGMSFIGRWDGSTWHPMSSGMDDLVLALQTFDGSLYVGGSFSEAGGIPSLHIARWDR